MMIPLEVIDYLYRDRLEDGTMGPIRRRLQLVGQMRHSQFGLQVTRTYNQMVVLRDLIVKCIEQHHEMLGHPGQKKTLETCKLAYYWPDQVQDCIQHCNDCHFCQARKDNVEHKRVPIEVYDIPLWPWSRLHIDLCTELPMTLEGYTTVLVVKCALTKWVEYMPIRSKGMNDVALAIAAVLSTWGVPDLIISDRGTEFKRYLVREIFGYKHIKTTAINPQANGQAEAAMKVIKTTLSSFVKAHQRDWSQYLGVLKMGVNGSINTVTGYSPYFFMTGREMSSPTLQRIQRARNEVPLDAYTTQLCEAMWYIWEGVSETATAKAAGISQAVGILSEEFRAYDSGDYVFIRRVPRRFYTDEVEAIRYHITAKLQKCRYTGAHKIIAKLSPTTYIVDVHNSPRTIHVCHMKPAGRFSVARKKRMLGQERMRAMRRALGVDKDEVLPTEADGAAGEFE
jgi:hypothetical protein